MAQIYDFPHAKKRASPGATTAKRAPLQAPVEAAGRGILALTGAKVIRALWVLLVVFWPLVKWAFAIDIVFQFTRMVYHWSDPAAFAWLIFLTHFAVFSFLTYLVSIYRNR